MTTIAGIAASLELREAAFVRGLDRAERALASHTAAVRRQTRQMERAYQGVQRSVANLRTGITALAGALAVRQFARFTGAAIEAGDAIAKQADRVGISTTELQRYRVVAGLSGVATEQLDRAVGDFARRLGDLRAGQGQLSTFLGRTNVALREQLAAAGSTGEAFEILVRRMANVGNAADRSALSVAGFGRAGGVAMTLFATALRDMTPEMQAFFDEILSLPEAATRQAEKLNDTIFVLRTAFEKGFHTGIIEGFASALDVTLDNTRELHKIGVDLGRTVGAAMTTMARAARFAAENMRAIAAAVGAVVAFRAARLFLDLGVAIGRAATAMVTLNAAMIANPIGLIAAAIAGAIAALILFHDRTIAIGPVSFTMGDVVTRIWQNIADGIMGVIRLIGSLSDAMHAATTLDFAAIPAALEEAWAGIAQVVRSRAGVMGMMFEDAEASTIDFSDKLNTVAAELRRAVGFADEAGAGIAEGIGKGRNPLIDLQQETRNLQAQLAQFRGGGFGALEAEQDVQAATAKVRQWAEANGIVIESFADLDNAARAMLDDFAAGAKVPAAAMTSLRDDIAATHRALLDAAEPIEMRLDTEPAHGALATLGVAVGDFVTYVESLRPRLTLSTASAAETIDPIVADLHRLADARPIPLPLDTATARAEVDELAAEIDRFVGDVSALAPRAKIDLDTSAALEAFDETIERLGRLQATATGGIVVATDVAPALAAVERLQEELFSITAPTVEIDADLADAQEAVVRLGSAVAALETSVGPIEAMVNLEAAFAQISGLSAALDNLTKQASAKPIVVPADTGPALASLFGVAAAHENLLAGLKPLPITVEMASAEADILRLAATIGTLPTEIRITATAHLGAALDEVARMEETNRQTQEQLTRETSERRAQEQVLAGIRQQLQQQIAQQQLLLAFAGEETEEYRVQLRMLELRTQLGAATAAGLEEQVRWAERLATELENAARATAEQAAAVDRALTAFDQQAQAAVAMAERVRPPLETLRVGLAEINELAAEFATILDAETVAASYARVAEEALRAGAAFADVTAELERQGTIGAEVSARMILDMAKPIEQTADAWESIAETFRDNMLSAIEAVIRGTTTLRNAVMGVVTDLSRAIGQQLGGPLGGQLGGIAGALITRGIGSLFGGGGGRPSEKTLTAGGGGGAFGISALTGIAGVGGSAGGGVQREMAGAITSFDQSMAQILTGRQALIASEALEAAGAQTRAPFRRFQIENEGADLLIKRAREIVGSLIEGIDVNRVMAGVGRDVGMAQQRVGAVAQIAAFIDPLTPVARAAADQVAALTLEFRNATTLAERFGIGLDRIGEGFERAAAELRRSLLDPLEATLRQQADQIRGFFDGLLGPIEGLLGQLRTGPLSALSPQQQFMEAQAEFQRLSGRAQGGDLEAISQIASAGQVFLQQAQQFGASGPIFTDAFREVNSVLSGLQDELRRQREQETAGLPTAGDEMLNDTLARMRGDIQQTNRHLEEVQRELQRLSSVRAA